MFVVSFGLTAQGRHWPQHSMAEFEQWEAQMWNWDEEQIVEFLQCRVWKEVRS